MISFASLEFMFRFLPVFLIIYYAFPTKHRNTILLIGSIVFYAVGEPVFILGLLTMMHKEFVIQNNSNVVLVFKETINQLVAGFNSIMNNGILEDWFAVGGGLIGGVLYGWTEL